MLLLTGLLLSGWLMKARGPQPKYEAAVNLSMRRPFNPNFEYLVYFPSAAINLLLWRRKSK